MNKSTKFMIFLAHINYYSKATNEMVLTS